MLLCFPSETSYSNKDVSGSHSEQKADSLSTATQLPGSLGFCFRTSTRQPSSESGLP